MLRRSSGVAVTSTSAGALVALALVASVGCGDDTAADGTGGSSGTADGTGGAGTGTGGTGTGGGGAAAAPFGSGSRIRAAVSVLDDGARVFSHFVDTELDAVCFFAPMTDGTTRCAPSGNSSVVFADADCTSPILQSYGCGAPDYAQVYVGDEFGCDTEYRVYRATTTPADVSEVFTRSGPSCVSGGAPQEGAVVGEEVSPDELVAAEERRTPLGGGLERVEIAFDDGAYMAIGAFDSERAAGCGPFGATGSVRCVTYDRAYSYDDSSEIFADAECSEPAGEVFAQCGDVTPEVVERFNQVECGYESELFVAGEALDTAYLVGADETCAEVEATTKAHFALGSPADLSAYPALDSGTTGKGRLQHERTAVGDAPLDVYGSLRDTELDVYCDGQLFVDGTRRCVPSYYALSGSYFGDAACTEPLVEVDAVCPGPAYIAQTAPADGCSTVVEQVYEVGAAFDGQVHVQSGAECVPLDGAPPSVASLGAAIPADTFAEIELTVE
jgi:hypothetical protein